MNTSMTNSARLLWAGLRALLVLTVVAGIVYPLVITVIAQGLFHGKANGSETEADGEVVGSLLIGQSYDLPLKEGQETPDPDLKWFQGRPANGLGTNSVNTRYELLLSGATNRSADDDEELVQWVKDAKAAVVKDNSVPGHTVDPSDVPADAVTSSGSGLDPHISPEYADIQVHRIAEKNGLSVERVQRLVDEHTESRTLGFIGEPRVNVLRLNIALEELVAES
ncbi:potassium-transporting ATPase subunit C [Streptomyces atrovirens]|uniref:Potassium-transporting ATPase KdpC subunit n=1 Tax=Streptomyces atrovirens TaxID=285556 RepID=A0ABW0E1T1_9ACTN